MDLFYAFLGLLQGVAEWLPISSKTVILLASVYLLGSSVATAYDIGLSLQAGTVAAAALYFRREIPRVFREKWLLKFLVVSTLATGLVGVPIYLLVRGALETTGGIGVPAIVIGLLLVAQAILYPRRAVYRGKIAREISFRDSFLFGIAQGLAAAPGISRSGITITVLLYLGYRLEDAMRLSFLASVIANTGALGVVYLFHREELGIVSRSDLLTAFIVSAVVGVLFIRLLLSLASRYREKLTLSIGLLAILIGSATLIHDFLAVT